MNKGSPRKREGPHPSAVPFALCALFFAPVGGDEESRTPDPLLARQVLSQLSYTPVYSLLLSPCDAFASQSLKIKQHDFLLSP